MTKPSKPDSISLEQAHALRSPWQVCVDIGGTKVALSLARGGAMVEGSRVAEPTAKEGERDALAQQIMRLVASACQRYGLADNAVQAVAISSCGPFVMEDGLIALAAPNICGGLAGPQRGLPNNWMSAALQAPLAKRYARVRVENDGVAALEAERRWGALQGIEDCAYVTWSTGIGVGLCVDGHILRGKNGNAGHAGHSFVSDSDQVLCGCGNVGDIEGLVAGNALPRRFGMDAAALMAAAQAGDSNALKHVHSMCRDMGRMLYNLVATLDLQRISLGGSVFWHNRDFLLPLLAAEVQSHLPALTAGVDLLPAGLGLDLGDYAALALLE